MRHLKKGFTIIEMVIVIAIIGILASVLIPTYGNVVGNSNEAAAHSTCLSAYKELYSTTIAKTGQYMRNGFVFISGDYAYTNWNGTLHTLRKLGTCELDNNDVSTFFLLGTASSTQDNKDRPMVFAMPSDARTYTVYAMDAEDGSGCYIFFVDKGSEGKSSGSAVALSAEYSGEDGASAYDAPTMFSTDKGFDPTKLDSDEFQEELLMAAVNEDWDSTGVTISCDSYDSITISLGEGQSVKDFKIRSYDDSEDPVYREDVNDASVTISAALLRQYMPDGAGVLEISLAD